MSTLSKRILVLDDSASVRTLIRLFLASRHFHIIEADSGMAALKLLETTTVDLIISDINMPGMTGLEFLQRLRARPGGPPSANIIVLSAEPNLDELGKQAKLSGADAVLKKPVSVSQLLEAVDRIFNASAASAQR